MTNKNSVLANGKLPPQNIDAEKCLLGAILINEEALVNVASVVKPQDFYDKKHSEIFNSMIDLFERATTSRSINFNR